MGETDFDCFVVFVFVFFLHTYIYKYCGGGEWVKLIQVIGGEFSSNSPGGKLKGCKELAAWEVATHITRQLTISGATM